MLSSSRWYPIHARRPCRSNAEHRAAFLKGSPRPGLKWCCTVQPSHTLPWGDADTPPFQKGVLHPSLCTWLDLGL